MLQGSLALAGLGLLSGCGLAPLGLQQTRIPRIGALRFVPGDPFAVAFLGGLRDLGYIEGQTIAIEWRSAEGQPDRLSGLAAEMVALKPDIIVTATTAATQAAKNATSTIPIVMISVGDPVGTGLVASLARPGGNVSGTTNVAPLLGAKRLELLKEAVPGLGRLEVLWNPTIAGKTQELRETEIAAQSLGIQLQAVEVRVPGDLDGAFTVATSEGAEALIPLGGPPITQGIDRIVAFAAQARLPAMYESREWASAGGLMAYGPNFPDIYRRGATYVDKILKGANPADLPVEQPTTFDFIINLKTAQTLGLTIPRSVLVKATQVID